jgi:hypothetical protein
MQVDLIQKKSRDPKIGHLLFKHLARRETINMKKLCFFKRSVFFFLAISILSYFNIIWIRHKDFFKTSICWIFLNIFKELLGEAKNWRIGYQK